MSIYDLHFNNTKGQRINLNIFKGKVLLIVNTATKCGLAYQFEQLEMLHQKYKDKGFVVIGFPCNQFANQEPESNETISNVCKLNFGVTFMLSEIISVNGKNTHPVFKYLKENAPPGMLGNRITWNFTKFLISADGKQILRFSPKTTPTEIDNDVLKFL